MSCYPNDAHWSQKGTGEREMQSEVVEDDRPGGSACASPAGKAKVVWKGSRPKARPLPHRWEGRRQGEEG
jgi:hypothetical protein